MATTIKFDAVEIANTTYIPRFVKHETAPDRQITSLPLSREDGEVLISERYGVKKIFLQGILTGADAATLEAAIDTFKELFSRPEKNLDVDWAGGTLRFVATCARHEFDRDHYNLNFVPWAAEFVVLSGEGKDTATTTLLNENPLNVASPVADSFTFAGSKPPKPLITLKGGNWPTGSLGFEYKNTDTGEKFIYTSSRSWATTASVIINCLLKKVTTDVGYSAFFEDKFYGVFPLFKVGLNNILLTVGGIVNQTTSDTVAADLPISNQIDATNDRVAQSFMVPQTDATFQGITLALSKNGTPGNMTVRIETDSNGKPSGTLADANATFTLTAASISSKAYYTKYSTNPWSLTANTTYWIVISAAATLDGSNWYRVWLTDNTSPATIGYEYTKGVYKESTDGGSTYYDNPIYDVSFRVLFGGIPAAGTVKHSVVYTKTYL